MDVDVDSFLVERTKFSPSGGGVGRFGEDLMRSCGRAFP
jgi:hypothetical protein